MNSDEFDIKSNKDHSNAKNHFNDSKLNQFLNESIYQDIKYQFETKVKLNELRNKYLPNSSRRSNSFMNQSQNMTYFNNYKNNSNFQFSTYTDYNYNNNAGANRNNISTEKKDYYKAQFENSIFQNSLLDNFKENNSPINESKSFINKEGNVKNNSNINLIYII